MSLILACLVAAASPDTRVTEADRALRMGRAEQARTMIRMAVADGVAGAHVDRLLADLAFVEQRWPEARARYEALLGGGCRENHLLERAGIAALQNGDLSEAIALLDRAVRSPEASWRAWSARAVAADRQGDWAAADKAYKAGLRLDPLSPLLLNNLGWSLLLRGQWAEARRHLEKAASVAHPADARILANLELAKAAVDANLPERRTGETNAAFAARLNDAGVIALRQGNRAKAAAAFARAIKAHDRWFARAANNLALVGEP